MLSDAIVLITECQSDSGLNQNTSWAHIKNKRKSNILNQRTLYCIYDCMASKLKWKLAVKCKTLNLCGNTVIKTKSNLKDWNCFVSSNHIMSMQEKVYSSLKSFVLFQKKACRLLLKEGNRKGYNEVRLTLSNTYVHKVLLFWLYRLPQT